MKNVIAGFLMIFSSVCYSASAIVLSETKQLGVAQSYPSVDVAKAAAIIGCQEQTKSKCRLLMSSGKPGWGAIVVGRDGFWIALSQNSEKAAHNLAMEECDKRYVSCKMVQTFFDSYAIEDYPDIIKPEDFSPKEEPKKELKKDEKEAVWPNNRKPIGVEI